MDVVPFSDEHLEDAGLLLAARPARQRAAAPLLPERFEDPSAAVEEVVAAWRAEGTSGAAALREGKLVGYLFGTPRDTKIRDTKIWGDNAWVEATGHAVEEAEDARDLYGAAAGRWVEEGRRRHYALLPATDAQLLDAWFRLGFGHQQAHGIQEVPDRLEVRIPDGFTIREPREEDIEELVAVDLALPTHQRSSPVFSDMALPTEDDVRKEWLSTIEGNEEKVLIGFRDGRPVACWSVIAADLSYHNRGLMLPERASYLAFASTLPEARGSGIGVALTHASLAAAREDGYSAMVTDWRVANLLASRFWPKRGFQTVFSRLYRSIP
jgi:ribosomal protein S18 acetylase RimI-like enzyme